MSVVDDSLGPGAISRLGLPTRSRRLTLSERWQVALVGAASSFVVALAWEVVARLRYPWDLFIWSESPFLTNLMKLRSGLHVFGSAADANSFVYSPGLEYVTFAVLAPFGLVLDIRACRAVSVGLGVAACVCGALAGTRIFDVRRRRSFDARAYVVFGALTMLLVLFKNFTADVCHPDNLLCAHLCLVLLLTCAAAERSDLGSALATAAFASLGVWAKQTGALAGLAVFVALLLARRDLRLWKRALPLAFVTVGATGAAVAPLLARVWSRFWVFEVLSAHPVHVYRIESLLHDDIAGVPHRAMLYGLAPFAWAWLALRRQERARRFARVWLVLAFGGPLPALCGYFKHMGTSNNLGLLDLWTAILILPCAWCEVISSLADGDRRGRAALPIGAVLLLLLFTIPTRIPPSAAQWAFGRELDADLSAAYRRHERVLLDHGASALVHAGFRAVPLDRANSILELQVAGKGGEVEMARRIDACFYDRIYLSSAARWYGDLQAHIGRRYRVLGSIRAPWARPEATGTEGLGPYFGYQSDTPLMNGEITIWIPRGPGES